MEGDKKKNKKGKTFIRGDDWIEECRAGSMTTVKELNRDSPQGCVEKKSVH